MNEESKLSHDTERSELERICHLFEEKFRNFKGGNLYSDELPKYKSNPEAVLLLEKVKKLHAQFHEAVAENRIGSKDVLLPFLSDIPKSRNSSQKKLIIEVIPSTGRGVFIDIDDAFEKMKEMIYMIAFYELKKGELKPIFEFLKFLYSYIQEQLGDEGGDTLPYDAQEVLKPLDTIDIIAGKALIKRHSEGLTQTEDVGIKWHTAIKADTFSVMRGLRDRLYKDIERMDEAKAVQTAVKDRIEKRI